MWQKHLHCPAPGLQQRARSLQQRGHHCQLCLAQLLAVLLVLLLAVLLVVQLLGQGHKSLQGVQPAARPERCGGQQGPRATAVGAAAGEQRRLHTRCACQRACPAGVGACTEPAQDQSAPRPRVQVGWSWLGLKFEV